MAPASAMVTLLLFAAGLAPVILAQKVAIEQRDIPPLYSLEATHLFYAFAGSEPNAEPSTVEFSDFRLVAKPGHEQQAAGYSAVSAALIPWAHFSELTDPEWLCVATAAGGELQLRDTPEKAEAVILPLKVGQVVQLSARLARPGIYALSFANCGGQGDLTIAGNVAVRNAHGYLGGNDDGKVSIYAAFATLLVVVLLGWLLVVFRRPDCRHSVHHGITMVTAVAAISSIAWLAAFSQENTTGEAPTAYRFAEALSGLKVMYSGSVVLTLALGLGVTHTELDTKTEWKIIFATGLLGLASIPALCLQQQRQFYYIPVQTVLATSAPAVVLGLFTWCWTFSALAGSMRRCRDLNQAEGLSRFQRTTLLLGVMSLALAVIGVAQLLVKPGQVSRLPLVLDHFASNAVFCGALLILLYLWAPGPNGFLLDNYAAQADEEVAQPEKGIPAGDDDDYDDHDILADDPEDRVPGATRIGVPAAAE